MFSTAFDTLHEPIAMQLHFNQYKKPAQTCIDQAMQLIVDHEYMSILGTLPDCLVKCKC